MKWYSALAAPIVLVAPMASYATIHVPVEQAQRDMFGASALTPAPLVPSSALQDQLHNASGVSLPFQGDRIWKAADGGWFIVDEVVGKHETITYAVGLDANGAVKKVEILDYHESYGYQVAEPDWMQQFVGKTGDAHLKLGDDIRNISGATLSSKHVTDGVKRVLALWTLALKGR